MKTKKSFLENCSNKVLAKKVLKQMGLDWKELIQYPNDYRDASAGVSGFIYYDDTVKFAKKNIADITYQLSYMNDLLGCEIKNPYSLYEDEQAYYNWMAWFALENTIQEVVDFVEQ